MRNLILTNKVLKALEQSESYKSKIFIPNKIKRLGENSIEAYESEKNGEKRITLQHHKKAQAIATLFDIGLLICVDFDRKPYYYFY